MVRAPSRFRCSRPARADHVPCDVYQTAQEVQNPISSAMRAATAAVTIALFAVMLPACGGSPVGPVVAECELNHTGDLDLVNLSDNFAPRDVYVDGHLVTTVPSGGHIIVTAAAGVVHTVEWVSTITGVTLDTTRVAIDECSTTTLNNHF